MEKGKSLSSITNSFAKCHLNERLSSKPIATSIPHHQPNKKIVKKRKPASLENLCLKFVGKHLEDLIPHLSKIAYNFPAEIKFAIVAIARRRRLLNDDVLVSLVDGSWEYLDLSGSDVSDVGLAKVAKICKFLRAVDISWCSEITTAGVSELIQHCRFLETFRCGGYPRSDDTARNSLGIFAPKLNNIEGDSWEELDADKIVYGAESLRWLVWPSIDKDTLSAFATECPRVVVNPKPSPFDFGDTKVPREALPDIELDGPVAENIDPETWEVRGSTPKTTTPDQNSSPGELSVAEKFRLAYVERDSRLALKRAKNARQHQRRAEREWLMMDERDKAFALSSKARKYLL